jgi:hypothetical protein
MCRTDFCVSSIPSGIAWVSPPKLTGAKKRKKRIIKGKEIVSQILMTRRFMNHLQSKPCRSRQEEFEMKISLSLSFH